MSRKRKSVMTYEEKKKKIERSSQLEIDRSDLSNSSNKSKKKKSTRRGSRGKGISATRVFFDEAIFPGCYITDNDKETVDQSQRKRDIISDSCERLNQVNGSCTFEGDQFVVALKYDPQGFFVDQLGEPTVVFKDAVRQCPKEYSIFNTEGIKVFPFPLQRLHNAKYTIRDLQTMQDDPVGYSELSSAIKQCKIGFGIYNPNNERVY